VLPARGGLCGFAGCHSDIDLLSSLNAPSLAGSSGHGVPVPLVPGQMLPFAAPSQSKWHLPVVGTHCSVQWLYPELGGDGAGKPVWGPGCSASAKPFSNTAFLHALQKILQKTSTEMDLVRA